MSSNQVAVTNRYVRAAITQIPKVTIDVMPDVTITSLPPVDIATLPAVNIATIPSITVSSLPNVNVSTMPSVAISTLPPVVISSMPSVTATITSLPNVNVTSIVPVDVATLPLPKNYFIEAAKGNIAGVQTILVGGYNGNVTTGGLPADVWSAGGTYPFQTSAQLLKIVSSSALDTSAGTGGRTIRVTGLDASFNVLIENVTLNGTGSVNLVGSFLRINYVEVMTAGSGGTNAGNVTLSTQTGSIIQGFIAAGAGSSQSSVYTVPNGKVGLLCGYTVSMLTTSLLVTPLCDYQLRIRQNGRVWNTYAIGHINVTAQVSGSTSFSAPVFIGGGGTDIRMTTTYATVSGTQLAAGYTLIIA